MKPVLDFIKAHTFALACAVVAIVGLVAYFVYPIPGMFAELEAEVKAREGVASSLKGLNDGARTLPVVTIDKAEGAKLDYFPTQSITAQGNAMLAKLAAEAKNVLDAAVSRNRREPLIADALVTDSNPIARQLFLQKYKLVTAQTGPEAEEGIIRRVLKGSLPPSPEELTQIGNQQAAQIATKSLRLGPNNQPINQPEVDAMIAEMRAKLPLQLRMQRAFNSQIYVSPDAVEIHPGLRSTQLPDGITVFNGQLSLWLQQIAFESIVAANGSSPNVFESPVKHLVKLNVPMNVVTGVAQPVGFGGDPNQPAAAAPVDLKPDPAAVITPSYTTDPLGYASNSLYDPFPIQLVLRVDSRKLPEALAKMQSARLVKVKNVSFRTVDKGLALQQGYIYDKSGDTPLVEVTLNCDVLLLRPWLVNYMSNPVKQFFQNLSTGGAIGAAPPSDM